MNVHDKNENLNSEPPQQEVESKLESYHHQFNRYHRKARSEKINADLLKDVQILLEDVIQHRGLGDFETLIDDLKQLESLILSRLKENLDAKILLCKEAEIPTPDDQLPALENLIHSFQTRWNQLGDVPPRDYNAVEKRFNQAIAQLRDAFDNYHMELLRNNLKMKEDICLQAEKTSQSKDWKVAGDQLIALEREWKKIGPVPKDQSENIWERFQSALNTFYHNRNEYYSEIEEKKRQNLIIKEKFCEEAEKISESSDWYDAEFKLTQLEEDWKKVGPVPAEQRESIWQRFQAAIEHFYQRRTEYFDNRQEELTENLKKKEELCVQAEALLNPGNWKEAEEKLTQIQKEWKQIGHVPLNQKDDIWKRFKTAVRTFYDNRKTFFKSRENEWAEHLKKKEAICAEAEELSKSDDWKKAERRIKELQIEWKKIGFVPHELSDDIWNRFQTAANSFFKRRAEFIKQEKLENLAKKEDLCRRAEALADSTDWKKTAETFKELQSEWKKIGFVPREYSDSIWQRFRKAADTFFENRDKHYDEIDPSWREHLKQKEAICKKAEKIRYSKAFDNIEKKFKELQTQMDEIGFIPEELNTAVHNRFKTSLEIFTRRLNAYREDVEKGYYENLKLKEKLCEEADAIPLTGDLKASIEKAKELQRQWKEIGPVPWKHREETWDRFHKTCDRVFRVARAEQKSRYIEWKKHLADNLANRKEQREKLMASIQRDEHFLERLSHNSDGFQDKWKAQLIEITQNDRLETVKNRLDSKRQRLEKLDKTILDMEKKLK